MKNVLQVYAGRSLRATPGDVKTPDPSRSEGKGLCSCFITGIITASVLLCLSQAVRCEIPYDCLQQAGM